ncbi:facilitated trehalose transporter Tret1-2 homolog [Stegodyphus dumicola]|uniref:facilitated trehalose transporter Tret1-2 homolog n=1 Tax=Stegodyphus dumicola TaxID=202533 RepID=UPI0015AC3EEF|nr:facilitated trehalose transporter Tret1-2 homolog [Stegodyphus dumicola]
MMATYSAPATVDMQKQGSRFIHVTEDEISWIASLPSLTAAAGNILSGYASQKLGRKAVLMYVSTVYLTGWLMITYASSVEWIYAGRALTGFCSGVCNVAVPVYVLEIATTQTRGLLTSGFTIAAGLGILITMGLGAVLRWSWLAVSAAVIITCAVCLMYFVPESPAWLVSQSRSLAAEKALKKLRGKKSDYKTELREISESQAEQSDGSIRLQDICDPAFYKPLAIAVTLMFFQMFCGLNVFLTYTVEIFESSGSLISPSLGSVIFAVVFVLSSGVSSILMDRAGRRKLYITSGGCMILSLTVLGVFSLLAAEHKINTTSLGWIPDVCFISYIASYSMGFGPVPYVMIPELVPLHSRSTVMAVSCIVGAICAFATSKLYYSMKSVLGIYGVYWTYASFSFLGCVFCYFFMPETKGKPLNEINLSFAASSDVSLSK